MVSGWIPRLPDWAGSKGWEQWAALIPKKDLKKKKKNHIITMHKAPGSLPSIGFAHRDNDSRLLLLSYHGFFMQIDAVVAGRLPLKMLRVKGAISIAFAFAIQFPPSVARLATKVVKGAQR